MTNDVTTLHSATAAQIRVNTAMKSLSSTIEGGLVSGLTDITMGTKTASQGFKDMGLVVVKALDEMIIKMMVVGPLMRGLQGMFGFSTYTAAPTVGADGLAAVHYTGGHITGPGTGTSDSIPAMLSNGEYVVNASATARFGPLLDAINSGVSHFADGGMASFSRMAPGGECGPEPVFSSAKG
jgi:hypothetical protein